VSDAVAGAVPADRPLAHVQGRADVAAGSHRRPRSASGRPVPVVLRRRCGGCCSPRLLRAAGPPAGSCLHAT